MSEATCANDAPATAAKQGRALHDAAFVLLLGCIAARCFLAELPFQGSALQFLPGRPVGPATSQPADNPAAYRADLSELSRMTFAMLLIAAGALWALGGALAGKLTVRHAWLAGLIGVFGGLSLISALAASNRRAALDGWVEQLALLGAGFLAVQLCADRRRFSLLVAVLAAVGIALAAKAYWQRGVEIPDRVADFDAHRIERLSGFGWDANTPQGELIAQRMRDTSVTGYFALANPFGSLLLVLGFAAAGLAIDKLRAGVRSWREGKARRRKGEIDLPSLAAGLAACGAAAVAVVVPLTKSRGAIVSAAAAAGALAVVLWKREALARHWRRWLAGVAGVGLLAAGGVAAYGLARDSLPTRTMTFRWYYWTATAEIVRESPAFGVGPGNFASAYLANRRDEAEEEIQMPHNAVAHALAAYGVPGGVCYLLILGYMLVGCVRPRRAAEPAREEPEGTRRGVLLTLAAIPASVLVVRGLFWDTADSTFMRSLELLGPPAVLAVMLAAAAWSGRGVWQVRPGLSDVVRPALACGIAGFLLHNTITYSLWLPATAGVFHAAGGACLARGPARAREIVRARWYVAFAAGAALAAAGVLLWAPVLRKTYHTARMLAALRGGSVPGAFEHAQRAVHGDPLDPRPAADAAEVGLMHVETPGTDVGRAVMTADWLADQAVRLDERNSACHRLSAGLAWAAATLNHGRYARALARGDEAFLASRPGEAAKLWAEAGRLAPVSPFTEKAVRRIRRAVRLDPKNSRLRAQCALLLCNVNRPRGCIGQLAESRRLDEALPAESVKKLRAAEWQRLAALRARAEMTLWDRAKAPTTRSQPASRPGRHRGATSSPAS